MVNQYHKYREGLKKFTDKQLEEIVSDDLNYYRNVRTYLDVIELLAIGIAENVFDENVCYGFWLSIVERSVKEGGEVILKARSEDGPFTYEELVRLSKRWKSRAERDFRRPTSVSSGQSEYEQPKMSAYLLGQTKR